MIRRVWRAFATFVTILVLGLIAIELVARYGLGLGDPPLSQNHPTIEYMLQPGRTYHRFGNEYRVNAYSMRSDPFPDQKSHPDERRVMVFGDSIVNGGNITDQ
ncbi:MAG: SGNH/GDSL hydrolase family protein, partial [Phycisphaeraceae bacterium]